MEAYWSKCLLGITFQPNVKIFGIAMATFSKSIEHLVSTHLKNKCFMCLKVIGLFGVFFVLGLAFCHIQASFNHIHICEMVLLGYFFIVLIYLT